MNLGLHTSDLQINIKERERHIGVIQEYEYLQTG